MCISRIAEKRGEPNLGSRGDIDCLYPSQAPTNPGRTSGGAAGVKDICRAQLLGSWQGKLVLCCNAEFVSKQHPKEMVSRGAHIQYEYDKTKTTSTSTGGGFECAWPTQQVSKEEARVAKATALHPCAKMARPSHYLDNTHRLRVILRRRFPSRNVRRGSLKN